MKKFSSQGEQGRCYLVRSENTGLHWVIKRIDVKNISPEERRLAAQEARILEKLNHPNIIQFRDVYKTVKFQLDIVMEYADGGDLSTPVNNKNRLRQKFTEEELLNICV